MLKTLRTAFLAFTAFCLTSAAYADTTLGDWKFTERGRYISLGDGDTGNEWFYHFTPAADYCGEKGDRYIRMSEALWRNNDDNDNRAIWWITHTCKGEKEDLVRICIAWGHLADACSSYYRKGHFPLPHSD